MTFVTRDIILSCGNEIATCHNRDCTRGNKKILQKKLKKLKKSESDTWRAVNGINYFFFLKGT